MTFEPRYTITDRLLANITRIYRLVAEFNSRRLSQPVLMELERTARSVSAYASTSIEGNPLPLTEVKRILKNHPQHVRDSEREVLNYNKILEELASQPHQPETALTLEQILKVQAQITAHLLPKFHCGHLRKLPIVVNDPRTGQIVFMPPDHGDVPTLMDDLVAYVNTARNEVDPLIVAGVFHKQFVLIHPFVDGNGRTARLVTKILLARMGLNTFNLFSFENYYNLNVTKYFAAVGESGDYYDLAGKVDFTAWLEYFTDGIIDELLRVSELLPTATEPELLPHHRIILDLIAEHGFTTDAQYTQHTTRAKATRNLDFNKLIDLGLITATGQGRATRYVAPDQNAG